VNIRTQQDILDLDTELDIFEEADWNFLKVDESLDNYEYFNDVRDSDFLQDTTSEKAKRLLPIMVCIAITSVVAAGSIVYVNHNATKGYKSIQSVVSAEDSIKQARVDGKPASNDEQVAIGNTLSGYFNALHSGDFGSLDKYVKSGSSLTDTYNNDISKTSTSYDSYDCEARALKSFANMCSVSDIHDVIKKDGVYYVYVDLNMPSSNAMRDYIYTYKYNFTKHFSGTSVTRENVLIYLLDTLESNPVSTKTSEYCLTFTEADGIIYLNSDSTILAECQKGYNTAISEVISALGVRLQK